MEFECKHDEQEIKEETESQVPKQLKSNTTCFKCGKIGHVAKTCRSDPGNNNSSYKGNNFNPWFNNNRGNQNYNKNNSNFNGNGNGNNSGYKNNSQWNNNNYQKKSNWNNNNSNGYNNNNNYQRNNNRKNQNRQFSNNFNKNQPNFNHSSFNNFNQNQNQNFNNNNRALAQIAYIPQEMVRNYQNSPQNMQLIPIQTLQENASLN